MQAVPEVAARLAEPWASFYNDAPLLQTVVLFLHLAGIVVGGGFALATDRATLRASGTTVVDRTRQLAEIQAVHRPVLVALAVTSATGALMFAADVETFAASTAFWIKMFLIALLLANGYAMTRAEATLRRSAEGGWGRLRRVSITSSFLWLAVLLAGTWLSNMS